jgi:uncharacterized protein YjbJ (UPF0337 family)
MGMHAETAKETRQRRDESPDAVRSGSYPNAIRKEAAMGAGTGDRAEGKKDRAVGKVREAVGRAQGDPNEVSEGRRQQTRGKGKDVLGTIKSAGQRIKRTVKD